MYIQVKDLGGQDRGLKFNQISLEEFTKRISVVEGQVNIASTVYATFYAGLIGNVVAKREEQDFTYENVMDWVDKLYEDKRTDVIKDVCDKWAETQTWKDWLEQFQERLRTALTPETKTDLKKKK